jgi:hypothetical protein
MTSSIRPILGSFLFFLAVTVTCIVLRSKGGEWGWDFDVLLVGNLVVFMATLGSYFLLRKSLYSKNPQAFVRAMYGSFILKFFIIVVAAFAYIMAAGKNANKPALFTSLGLYFIYMFIEISVLTRMMKNQKNVQERSPS